MAVDDDDINVVDAIIALHIEISVSHGLTDEAARLAGAELAASIRERFGARNWYIDNGARKAVAARNVLLLNAWASALARNGMQPPGVRMSMKQLIDMVANDHGVSRATLRNAMRQQAIKKV